MNAKVGITGKNSFLLPSYGHACLDGLDVGSSKHARAKSEMHLRYCSFAACRSRRYGPKKSAYDRGLHFCLFAHPHSVNVTFFLGRKLKLTTIFPFFCFRLPFCLSHHDRMERLTLGESDGYGTTRTSLLLPIAQAKASQ